MMLLWMISCLILLVFGLALVAFFTLMERKLLGLSQARLGPNKSMLMGLLQPVLDGLKLLAKAALIPTTSQILLIIGPVISLSALSIFWVHVLPWEGGLSFRCSALMMFLALSFSAYSVILMSWGVTSEFSKLGSMRSLLQSLSFEVSLILAFLVILIFSKSMNFSNETLLYSCEIFITWSLLWTVMCLVESNRAPFDLLEGESELISGFNIEMGSVMFVLVFLSEYGMMFSLSMLISIPLKGSLSSLALLCASLLLFVRSCFPRLRYDYVMIMMWQAFLPVLVMFSFYLKFVMY